MSIATRVAKEFDNASSVKQSPNIDYEVGKKQGFNNSNKKIIFITEEQFIK